jgi:ABC-2 type transport system ATP-binding protein
LIPTHGSAQVCGFDVAREPAKVRLQIGYHTGGDACFYARLTARENLVLFACLNNLSAAEAQRRIDELTEPFGLGELLDRQVRMLSTGNVHRLGLARAMLHRPSVLILDEPTRSLDPLAASAFRRLLKEDLVRQRGATLLFASHALSEVEEIADRVVLLDHGRVIACDSPRGLRASTRAATLEAAIASLVHASPYYSSTASRMEALP